MRRHGSIPEVIEAMPNLRATLIGILVVEDHLVGQAASRSMLATRAEQCL